MPSPRAAASADAAAPLVAQLEVLGERKTQAQVDRDELKRRRAGWEQSRRYLETFSEQAATVATRLDGFGHVEWQDAIDQTLFPAIRASRLAVPHMLARGGGAIVMIASIWGRESGGRMTDVLNNPLRYNTAATQHLDGLIASNRVLHDRAVEAARAVLVETGRSS